MLDFGARDAGEAYKALARFYPKADPTQLALIVSHWENATTAPEVTPEAPVVVTPLSGVVRPSVNPAAEPDADQADTEG